VWLATRYVEAITATTKANLVEYYHAAASVRDEISADSEKFERWLSADLIMGTEQVSSGTEAQNDEVSYSEAVEQRKHERNNEERHTL